MYNNRDNELDKTRKMDPVTPNDFVGSDRSDIEIKDVKPKEKTTHGFMRFFQKKQTKICLLVIVFILALAGGFSLSSYYNDKEQLAENESIHQQQELKRQQADLEQQKKDLETQRKQLEQEKEALNASKNAPDQSASSWLGSVLDSVTGEKGQKAEQGQGNNSSDNNVQIDKKIAQAQEKIDEINNNLGKFESMKQGVSHLQGKLEETYQNNQELFDTIKFNLQKILQ